MHLRHRTALLLALLAIAGCATQRDRCNYERNQAAAALPHMTTQQSILAQSDADAAWRVCMGPQS
jgi:hypothetical protein